MQEKIMFFLKTHPLVADALGVFGHPDKVLRDIVSREDYPPDKILDGLLSGELIVARSFGDKLTIRCDGGMMGM